MRLLQVTGVGKSGNCWTVNIPADAKLFTLGDRLLVASPMNMLWIDANGDMHQATSYPKAYCDDGA